MLERMVGCLLMAVASLFAFRCGNLAVGAKFDPDRNWSAAIIAQLALLVTQPTKDALVLPKPTTKTSHSSSSAARRLAREPVPVSHDPGSNGDPATIAFFLHWFLYWDTPLEQLRYWPAFPDVHRGLHWSVDLAWYSKFQDYVTHRHIPEWAHLLSLTEYSLRIGTATAWVEAGASAAELKHLGKWATDIGSDVYARLSVERQLRLQQSSLSSEGTSLDSLLRMAEASTASGSAVFVQGAAPTRAPSGATTEAHPQPAVDTRSFAHKRASSSQPTLQAFKFAKTTD